ncbi:TRAP transporter substrate-binding protein DctP [Microbacterium sp. A93]|uniref:TRAP transporter substrate-binding protein DctP n=1 Tax=Microbacterium sp. A93 TaxID=3450716 RepID=UPI003F42C806
MIRIQNGQQRRRVVPVTMAAVLVLGGCAAGGSDTNDEASQPVEDSISTMEPIVLSLAEANVEQSAVGAALTEYMDYIEERTDGKVTFEPYWATSLAPLAQTLNAVSTGLADIGVFVNSYYPDEMPGAAWLSNLGTMSMKGWPHSYLQSHAATIEFVATSDELQAEFTAQNVRPIYLGSSPMADMFCTRPIVTLEDAEGKRARVGGPPWSTSVEALGMTAVSFSSAESYEGLQRGIADCTLFSAAPNVAVPMGISDVAPYYSSTHTAGIPGNGHIMNLDVWNSLPVDVQQIFTDASALLATSMATEMIRVYSEFAASAEADGYVFVDTRQLNEVLDAHNTEVEAGLAATAPAVISDPEGEFKRYRELLAKWEAAITSELGLELEEDLAPEAVLASYIAGTDFDVDRYRKFLEEVLQDGGG